MLHSLCVCGVVDDVQMDNKLKGKTGHSHHNSFNVHWPEGMYIILPKDTPLAGGLMMVVKSSV